MPMSSPKAGVNYPGNLAAVRVWFPDDAACLDSHRPEPWVSPAPSATW